MATTRRLRADDVRWAGLAAVHPAFKGRGNTARQRMGLRYQEWVDRHLDERYKFRYVAGPWFQYLRRGSVQPRHAQPDGLLFDVERGHIVLVETKYTHTGDAWVQLSELYLPLVRRVFPPELWTYSMCEICRWYDPALVLPVRQMVVLDLDELMPGEFGAYIWKP